MARAKPKAAPSRRGGARPNSGRKPMGAKALEHNVNLRLDQQHYEAVHRMAAHETTTISALFRQMIDTEVQRREL